MFFRHITRHYSSKASSVRGTRDILPHEHNIYNFIVQTASQIAERYGFKQMSTPIIEHRGIFTRTLGEDSDVVSKEMYTFIDKNKTPLCLRPENTAGIVRAYLTNQMKLPLKCYYHGPMFRYERPQMGRYRQFHQFGVEHLGASHPHSDVQVISMAYDLLRALGIENVILELNTLGNSQDRSRYKKVLEEYLKKHESNLSKVNQEKLKRKSVLRVLDSKLDREVIDQAPKILDYLSDESLLHFQTVLEGLKWLNIPFKISPHLVRGLDYYCHTTFEFKNVSTESCQKTLGTQDSVLAGGRYDQLVEMMGGPSTPAIGWACGIERMALLLDEKKIPPDTPTISVVAFRSSTPQLNSEMIKSENGNVFEKMEKFAREEPVFSKDDLTSEAIKLCQTLRNQGFHVHYHEQGNVTKQLSKANSVNSRVVIIVAPDEFSKGYLCVKNMKSGEQELVSTNVEILSAKLNEMLK